MNLDDLFLLTVFFARRVPTRRIVAGQYLGFSAIIALSLAAAWGVTQTIPRGWIRLLGIVPLAIGVTELIQMHKSSKEEGASDSYRVLSIAAITLSNGADNIGIYVPFFLVSREHISLVILIYGFLILRDKPDPPTLAFLRRAIDRVAPPNRLHWPPSLPPCG